MELIVKYQETDRPAVGLTIEQYDPVDGKLLTISRTDGAGCAYGIAANKRTIIRRGNYVFSETTFPSGEATRAISISWDQVPDLKQLRELLLQRDVKCQMAWAANVTLGKLVESPGLLTQLLDGVSASRGDTENQHDIVGALQCALGVSRLFTINAGFKKAMAGQPIDDEIKQLRATKGAMKALIKWAESLRHPNENGFLFRWTQERGLEDRTPNNWEAEPSLDEYSGLLMGLNWAMALVADPGFLSVPSPQDISSPWNSWVKDHVANLFRGVNEYLISSHGMLVRPNNRDYVIRGPNLVWYSYPLSLILFGYSIGEQYRVIKPLEFTRKLEEFLETSKNHNQNYPRDEDPHKRYDDTIHFLQVWEAVAHGRVPPDPLILALLSWIRPFIDSPDLVEWVGYGEVLGDNKDSGSNLAIFDRFSVAAFWLSRIHFVASPDPNELRVIQKAFSRRAKRDWDHEDEVVRSFGKACKVWFGEFSEGYSPANFVDKLIHEAARLYEPRGLWRRVDGFVYAWSLICLALDIDPELTWDTVIDHSRYGEYEELGHHQVPVPRLECVLDTVKVEKRITYCTYSDGVRVPPNSTEAAREAFSLPSLWLIPIRIDSPSNVLSIISGTAKFTFKTLRLARGSHGVDIQAVAQSKTTMESDPVIISRGNVEDFPFENMPEPPNWHYNLVEQTIYTTYSFSEETPKLCWETEEIIRIDREKPKYSLIMLVMIGWAVVGTDADYDNLQRSVAETIKQVYDKYKKQKLGQMVSFESFEEDFRSGLNEKLPQVSSYYVGVSIERRSYQTRHTRNGNELLTHACSCERKCSSYQSNYSEWEIALP